MTLKSRDLRVLCIDLKCLSHIGFHLQAFPPLDVDLREIDIGVGQFVIPKDRGFERTRGLIAIGVGTPR